MSVLSMQLISALKLRRSCRFVWYCPHMLIKTQLSPMVAIKNGDSANRFAFASRFMTLFDGQDVRYAAHRSSCKWCWPSTLHIPRNADFCRFLPPRISKAMIVQVSVKTNDIPGSRSLSMITTTKSTKLSAFCNNTNNHELSRFICPCPTKSKPDFWS